MCENDKEDFGGMCKLDVGDVIDLAKQAVAHFLIFWLRKTPLRTRQTAYWHMPASRFRYVILTLQDRFRTTAKKTIVHAVVRKSVIPFFVAFRSNLWPTAIIFSTSIMFL